jgi:hypothetical protein
MRFVGNSLLNRSRSMACLKPAPKLSGESYSKRETPIERRTTVVGLRARNPNGHPPEKPSWVRRTDAVDRLIAEMSSEETAAALRLLKVLEECRRIFPAETEK